MRHRMLTMVLILVVVRLVPCADGQALRESVDQARSVLREGVGASDPLVRVEAITSVGMIGNHELVVARLEKLLEDKDVRVRLATIRALADLESMHSIELLRRVLEEDKVPEVSFAAAKALEKLKDPAGTRALMDVYDGKRKTRSGMIGKKKRETTDQFHSVPSGMMFVVSRGAGYVPVPGVGEGFSAFTTLVRDKGLSDRAGVVLILGQSKDAEVTKLLRDALHDSDWSVRAAAVQMIAHSARVELRDDLLPLFNDKNQKVQFRAAGAFLHLALIQYPQK